MVYVSLFNHSGVILVSSCDNNGIISSISNYGSTAGKQRLMEPV
jgi:hypothetical protein